jgi:uncharacterized protein YlaI
MLGCEQTQIAKNVEVSKVVCVRCNLECDESLFKARRLKGELVRCIACIPCNAKLAVATKKYQSTENGKEKHDSYSKSDKARVANTEKMANYPWPVRTIGARGLTFQMTQLRTKLELTIGPKHGMGRFRTVPRCAQCFTRNECKAACVLRVWRKRTVTE